MLLDVSQSHDLIESSSLYKSLPYSDDTKDIIKMCVSNAYNTAKAQGMFFLIPHSEDETLTLYLIDTNTGEYTSTEHKIPTEKVVRDIFIMMIIDNFFIENFEKNIGASAKACELMCSTVLEEDKIFEYIFGKPFNE